MEISRPVSGAGQFGNVIRRAEGPFRVQLVRLAFEELYNTFPQVYAHVR